MKNMNVNRVLKSLVFAISIFAIINIVSANNFIYTAEPIISCSGNSITISTIITNTTINPSNINYNDTLNLYTTAFSLGNQSNVCSLLQNNDSFSQTNHVKSIISPKNNINPAKTENISIGENNFAINNVSIIPPKNVSLVFNSSFNTQIINPEKGIQIKIIPIIKNNTIYNLTYPNNYTNNEFGIKVISKPEMINKKIYLNFSDNYTNSTYNLTVFAPSVNDLVFNWLKLNDLYTAKYNFSNCKLIFNDNGTRYCADNISSLFFGTAIANKNISEGLNSALRTFENNVSENLTFCQNNVKNVYLPEVQSTQNTLNACIQEANRLNSTISIGEGLANTAQNGVAYSYLGIIVLFLIAVVIVFVALYIKKKGSEK